MRTTTADASNKIPAIERLLPPLLALVAGVLCGWLA